MRQWRRILALALAVVLSAGCMTNLAFAAERSDTGDRLIYDGVKYRLSQAAKTNETYRDTRSGLLLYSKKSGAKAEFAQIFSGAFEMEMKALGEGTMPDLALYTVRFTDVLTEQSFSVGISDEGTVLNAYVAVEEEKTGIYYIPEDGKAHGYTTVMNNSKNYTAMEGSGATALSFDPTTMEIRVKTSDADEYKTVWCLAEEVMDGRRYGHVLDSFTDYRVTVEFTTAKEGIKNQLLIYSVNGEDYGNANLQPIEPKVDTNLMIHAISGEKYQIPQAAIFGVDAKSSDAILCSVYDADGKELVSGTTSDELTFTPKKPGIYYLWYASDEGTTGTYDTISAYQKKDITCSISGEVSLPKTVGLETVVSIPAREVKSNLLLDDKIMYTDIVVKQGDTVVCEEEKVSDALTYTFKKAGTYTIEWSTELYGTTYRDTVTVEASADVPGIVGADLQTRYEQGTELKLPNAKVYLHEKEYKTKVELKKPSGEIVSKKTAVLDEVGRYEVTYSYKVEKEEKTFTKTFLVEYNMANTFTAGKDTKVFYDDTEGNADMPGVQIEMSSKNSSAVYSRTLDLSDNTKLDDLIELYLIPSEVGTSDLTGFYINLTDKLDRTNRISIRVVQGEGNMVTGAFVKGKATGQSAYTGWWKNHTWDEAPYTWIDEKSDVVTHIFGGYTCDLDFGLSSMTHDLERKTLKLRYDAQEKAIYGEQIAQLVHDESYRELLIVDFDDPELFTNLWSGFTDDSQVELSIVPMTVSGTATFKVLSVDGLKMDREIITDTVSPEVTVDYLGMPEAPVGKVGLAYKVFDVHAIDDLCDDKTLMIDYKVTIGDTEVEVKDGYFTPQTAGNYSIVYRIADGFGNVTEKTVNVKIAEDVPKLSMVMDSAFPEKITYGMNFYAPKFHGTGGSGTHFAETSYIYEGKEEKFTGSFVPEKEGTYTVVLTLKDYIGQTITEKRTYELKFTPEILFEDDQIVLPTLLLSDRAYEFDAYTASYYKKVGGEKQTVACVVEVTDAAGTKTLEAGDYIYTPKSSDSVTEAIVRFIFNAKVDGKELKKEIMRKIPLRQVQNTNYFMTDYFINENATLDVLNRHTTIAATTTSGNAKTTFVRPIGARNLSIVLSAAVLDNGTFRSNFETLRVTLTDKDVPDVTARFDITKSGDGLMLSINGSDNVPMPSSLNVESKQSIVLSYNSQTNCVTGAQNVSFGEIKTTPSGEAFTGFVSDEVYVSIEMLGIKGDSAINLVSINSQTFLRAAKDTVAPELFVNGSYSGTFESGVEFTLPTASAYDVLSHAYRPTVTVTDSDGKAITADDGTELLNVPADREYKITISEIGSYSVSYTTKDFAGMSQTAKKTIEIYDGTPPTVTLKRNLPDTVRAGKKVKIKKYTIEDNIDADKVKVLIYCGTPSGVLKPVKKGVIQTDEKGTYRVYFYMTDVNGNTNVQSFAFQAK